MGLQSRATVFAAIAAMLALMGGIVYYASLDNPELEKVKVELGSVELLEINKIENNAKLQVTFQVTNPSEKTFTVSVINYELYANGEHLGTGVYSTEDVAMPGRAAFYGGTSIPLKNIFHLEKNTIDSGIYDAIINEENLDYSTNGIITVETAWSLIEKEF